MEAVREGRMMLVGIDGRQPEMARNPGTSWGSNGDSYPESPTAVRWPGRVPTVLPSPIFDAGASTSPSWSLKGYVLRGPTPYGFRSA